MDEEEEERDDVILMPTSYSSHPVSPPQSPRSDIEIPSGAKKRKKPSDDPNIRRATAGKEPRKIIACVRQRHSSSDDDDISSNESVESIIPDNLRENCRKGTVVIANATRLKHNDDEFGCQGTAYQLIDDVHPSCDTARGVPHGKTDRNHQWTSKEEIIIPLQEMWLDDEHLLSTLSRSHHMFGIPRAPYAPNTFDWCTCWHCFEKPQSVTFEWKTGIVNGADVFRVEEAGKVSVDLVFIGATPAATGSEWKVC